MWIFVHLRSSLIHWKKQVNQDIEASFQNLANHDHVDGYNIISFYFKKKPTALSEVGILLFFDVEREGTDNIHCFLMSGPYNRKKTFFVEYLGLPLEINDFIMVGGITCQLSVKTHQNGFISAFFSECLFKCSVSVYTQIFFWP